MEQNRLTIYKFSLKNNKLFIDCLSCYHSFLIPENCTSGTIDFDDCQFWGKSNFLQRQQPHKTLLNRKEVELRTYLIFVVQGNIIEEILLIEQYLS